MIGALDQHASQRCNQERRRNGHEDRDAGVSGHRHLDNVGGVGAEHHQLAVRHVDDSHDAERNRESDGNQHEHGSKTQSEKQAFGCRNRTCAAD